MDSQPDYVEGYILPTGDPENILVDHGNLGLFDKLGRRTRRNYRKQNDPNGFEFYKDYLKSPKYIMAPMVCP